MENSSDTIVIGSGISGGWATKVLCKKGLKTCVVERGRNVEQVSHYVMSSFSTGPKKVYDHLSNKNIDIGSDKEMLVFQSYQFYIFTTC